jgi:hypothetical protein
MIPLRHYYNGFVLERRSRKACLSLSFWSCLLIQFAIQTRRVPLRIASELDLCDLLFLPPFRSRKHKNSVVGRRVSLLPSRLVLCAMKNSKSSPSKSTTAKAAATVAESETSTTNIPPAGEEVGGSVKKPETIADAPDVEEGGASSRPQKAKPGFCLGEFQGKFSSSATANTNTPDVEEGGTFNHSPTHSSLDITSRVREFGAGGFWGNFPSSTTEDQKVGTLRRAQSRPFRRKIC